MMNWSAGVIGQLALPLDLGPKFLSPLLSQEHTLLLFVAAWVGWSPVIRGLHLS